MKIFSFFVVLAIAAVANDRPGKEHFKAMRKACHGDVEKFCKDVEKGHGRIIACLKKNKAQLSAECQKDIDALPHRDGQDSH